MSCQNILVFLLIIVGYIGWKIALTFLRTFFAKVFFCFGGGEKENETEDDQGTYTKEKDVID